MSKSNIKEVGQDNIHHDRKCEYTIVLDVCSCSQGVQF